MQDPVVRSLTYRVRMPAGYRICTDAPPWNGAEVLAIVITDGMATRRRIEEVRGAAQLSIGPEGPVSLPRDSSETLALLLSRGLLCADRDDQAMGRPLAYRPTPRLIQLLGVETLEEVRGKLGVLTNYPQ